MTPRSRTDNTWLESCFPDTVMLSHIPARVNHLGSAILKQVCLSSLLFLIFSSSYFGHRLLPNFINDIFTILALCYISLDSTLAHLLTCCIYHFFCLALLRYQHRISGVKFIFSGLSSNLKLLPGIYLLRSS